MNKYQGDDISIAIQLESDPESKTDKQTICQFERVLAYVYTDACFQSKFAWPKTDGFYELHKQDDKTLFGVIESADTKRMHGNIIVELMFESDSRFGDRKDNVSRKINTGIQVLKTQIKHEI